MLGAAAVDAVEFLNRHFHLTHLLRFLRQPLVQVDQRLHRALAEGLPANDDTAFVVLNGSRENLRCRRAEAVHQHGHRPVVHHRTTVFVSIHFRLAGRFFHLYYRSFRDKQTREVDGLGQRATAVVAQVDHDTVDFFNFQRINKPLHVARCAAEAFFAFAGTLEITVEHGYVDNPDPEPSAIVGHLDDLFFGPLLFEFDFLAHDPNFLRRCSGEGVRRNHLQPDNRAFGTFYQFHHLIDLPVHGVDHRAVVALRHARNLVVFHQ